MKTLLTYLQLFPTILAGVKALEEHFPLPGTGAMKLDLILKFVESAYNAEQTIQHDIPWAQLAGVVKGCVSAVVSAFNAMGLFKHAPTTGQ